MVVTPLESKRTKFFLASGHVIAYYDMGNYSKVGEEPIFIFIFFNWPSYLVHDSDDYEIWLLYSHSLMIYVYHW